MKISPEVWKDADGLLDRALDLPAPEREAFIRGEAGGNAALLEHALELLQAMQGGDSFLKSGGALEGGVFRSVSDELERDRVLEPGSRVGPYRVVQELGRGGMAVVYLAERADGLFQQEVALKVVKRGTDTDEVVRRFEQERQILATLNHPNIARLLDGGVLPDGRPFLAMERVVGQPIDRFCDDRSLSIEDRLKLFMEVGRAVDYAHRNLVVHRDLKPSNILVTREGQVKLLDFGIAKLLDPIGEVQTRTVARLMTPDYASPEQVRGQPITTATDTYQLGLILYELLTGRRAQRIDTWSAVEIERAVCEHEPVAPSAALVDGTMTLAPAKGDGDGGVQEAAAHPRTTNDRVRDAALLRRQRRRLRGDLDNIVLKALRKEPARRYASSEQLVEDLERFLTGMPVRARPDTVRYRVDRFVRRNAAAVTATLLVLLTIGGLIGFYTARLADERDRARLEAEKARQVSDFLAELFDYSNPGVSGGERVTVREALDQGAKQIDKKLAEPSVRATMQTVIGRVYRQLGAYQQSLPLLEQAVATRRALYGTDFHPEVADSLNNLGALLFQMGRYQEAHPHLERSLEVRRQILSPDDSQLANSLNETAVLAKTLGDYETARQRYEESLEIFKRSMGPRHLMVGLGLVNLGQLAQKVDQLDVAKKHLELAREIAREAGPPALIIEAVATGAVGEILRMQGDFTGAKPLLDQAQVHLEKIYNGHHPLVGWILECQADLKRETGDLTGAQGLYGRALKIYEAEDHADSRGGALTRLSDVLRRNGDLEGARKQAELGRASLEKAFGAGHPDTGESLLALARVARAEGKHEEAEELARTAHGRWTKVFGRDHRLVLDAEVTLAGILGAQRRLDEADTLLKAVQPRVERPGYGSIRRGYEEALAVVTSARSAPEAQPSSAPLAPVDQTVKVEGASGSLEVVGGTSAKPELIDAPAAR